jgi:hypothetical protein
MQNAWGLLFTNASRLRQIGGTKRRETLWPYRHKTVQYWVYRATVFVFHHTLGVGRVKLTVYLG